MAHEYAPYIGPIITRAEAKAAGLPRFFTGKPCKHGHLSQRTTANGGCIACNMLTSAALYKTETPEARAVRNARLKAWKDANRGQVRAEGRAYSKAHREQSNAWKAANREKINAANREARQRNPEAYKASVARYLATEAGQAKRRAYYEVNAETIKLRVRAWAKQNPDLKREAAQARYLADKDAVKQRVREWNEANPNAGRVRGRNYRARKYQAEGSHTLADVEALHAKQAGRCVYCRKALGRTFHVDHIQPLSKGGSNWPSNLQLTCGPCNNRKRATDPIAFAQRLGRLI